MSLTPVPHAGKFLVDEILKPRGITQAQLARMINSTNTQISSIVNGRLGISAKMALRISTALGVDPLTIMSAQTKWEVWKAREEMEREAALGSVNARVALLNNLSAEADREGWDERFVKPLAKALKSAEHDALVSTTLKSVSIAGTRDPWVFTCAMCGKSISLHVDDGSGCPT